MPIASTKAPTELLSAASVVQHALTGAVHTLQPPSLCISSHHVAAPPPPRYLWALPARVAGQSWHAEFSLKHKKKVGQWGQRRP